MNRYRGVKSMYSVYKRSVGLLVVALFCVCHATGHAQDIQLVTEATTAASGAKWALIICGIPGDEDHHKLFSESIESLHQSLTTSLGFPAANIHIQFGAEPSAEDGPAVAAAGGQATRSELNAAVARLREELQPSDALWVFVLGHAHYDGRNSYLNLPGAGDGETDIHQDDFGKLFQDIPAAQQVFFITTAVSGYFIRPLSAKGRVVITATEADREVNETLFHAALAETLSEPTEKDKFDVDDDDKITLFDLYINVTQNVARRYLAEMLLATEHAQLDDNGDGRGTELQLDYLTEEEGGRVTPGSEPPKIRPNSDGHLAQQIVLPIIFPASDVAESLPEAPAPLLE
ncbi:MAG TPA: hypothetical protein VMM76_08845 [Pirellulaceae bacterium]|nr:hypothetical protein [Pirellulaceae bacterium]